MSATTRFPRLAWLLAAALLLASLGLYAPVGGHDFVSYDDDEYVTENPQVRAGLTAAGVRWAFTSGHASNWHPLTWLSHMLDVELFGLEPGGHHRTSALLHALSAALLLLALVALTGSVWPSALAAALFALHPLRVESVAWVSERKDVLAGVFWMLTLLAYARHARRPSPLGYLLLLAAFALGLLAKPMVITLPFVLLLLDRWPLRRAEGWGRLVVEKLPLLALALGSCVVTYFVQREGGAFAGLERLGPGSRASNALLSYGRYLGDTLWPGGLACYYPHPAIVDPAGYAPWGAAALGAGLLVAVLSAGAVVARRRAPWLLVGWLWFLGTLVPVIGLVQVGIQSHADRYTYLPGIGIAIAIAWSGAELARARPRLRPAVAALGAAWLVALAPLTWRQVATWRDSEALFEHALAVTEKNFMAHTNLGAALEAAGRYAEAAEHYEAALAMRPDVAPVHYNLAIAVLRLGRRDEAIAAFRQAVRLRPDYAPARINLGLVLAQGGQDAEAATQLRVAWEAGRPLPAGQGLAWVLATSRDDAVRDGAEAVRVAEACLAASPAPDAGLLETLAAAHAEARDFPTAARWQRAAIQGIPPQARGAADERLGLYEAGQPFRKDP